MTWIRDDEVADREPDTDLHRRVAANLRSISENVAKLAFYDPQRPRLVGQVRRTLASMGYLLRALRNDEHRDAPEPPDEAA